MSSVSPDKMLNNNIDRQILSVVLLLMVFSVSFAGYGLSSQISPVRPSSAFKDATQQERTAPAETSKDTQQLPFSRPIALSIPSIQIESPLIEVGKNADGTIEIPSGADYDKAAWYKYGPAPGQTGSAVIEGHVDSPDGGPSVFFALGGLAVGQSVFVDREDGIRAEFIVEGVNQYTKEQFPTESVYGHKDHASLTLITCSGNFNADSGEYESNIVVTGYLKSVSGGETLTANDV